MTDFINQNNLAVGIDLTEINRFDEFKLNGHLAKNIFSHKELLLCSKKPNPKESFAVRFAAKEAIRKCIKENLRYNLIEILSSDNGQPVVNILDSAVKKKYRFLLSMTHTTTLAEAICICFTK